MRSRVAVLTILWVGASWGTARSQAQKPAPTAKPAVPQVKLVPRMPAGAPPKPFRFPKAETKTLANGLRVFVVASQPRAGAAPPPAVTLRMVLTAAGAVNDPLAKPGVAGMTAELLTQGTEKRSAQQIAEAIDFVGGSLTASADSDATYVTASVVKKDLDLALDLLSDVVLHAAFKDEELDRRRQQLLSNLRLEYADPGYLATAVFDRVVYGRHPYGLPEEGTPDSVARLERADLVRFRDAYYVPNQALLAFAGEITPEAAFAAAEKYFGAWAKKELAAMQTAVPAATPGLRIYLLDKPDAVQTQIRVGRLGIPRNHPDFIPLYVTNRIFGGGFNSRLNTEVRQKKGLTYDASSRFSSRKLAGSFVAASFTRTETTVEATRLIVDLIARMATGEVTPAELDFARDYLAGVFPIQSETAEHVAGRILNVAQFDLPADYNDTYQEKVRAVGPDQVKAMAARYFAVCASPTPCGGDADNLALVLVGNVKQFRDALRQQFPAAKFEEMPFDQVDLLGADLRRAKEVVPPATPESLARGSAILLAAAEAAGGAALARIESLEYFASGKFFGPQGELAMNSKITVVYPGHVHVETSLPFGVVTQGFDGQTAWQVTPEGAVTLPPILHGEFQRLIALLGGWGVLQQGLAGKVRAQFLGEEKVEDKKALAVDWILAGDDEERAPAARVRLYFDPETHLLFAARYRQPGPQGLTDVLEVWSDFRPVAAGAALKLPYSNRTYRNAAKYSEAAVQEVKLNTKPDPALFAKPK